MFADLPKYAKTMRKLKRLDKIGKQTLEGRIMGYILDGTASQFARALSLMLKGYDREMLIALGHRCRITCRTMKTIFVADGLLAGEIKKDQYWSEIRRLVGSAGNAVKRSRSTSSPCRPRSPK